MKAIINEIIDIKLSTNYEYVLGSHLLDNLSDHVGLRHDQKLMILSDENVWELYGMRINNSFSSHKERVEILVIKPGEEEKNFANLQLIVDRLAEGFFRSTDLLLCIGGGVICDLGGLAAGLYMRGMKHVLVTTTTLAAVDAGVGGKTAINLQQGKNLLGLFKQPSRVICDIEAFDSLSDRIFYEGLAEAIKMAFISSAPMLNLFRKDIRTDKACLLELIKASVKYKYLLVKKDEYDKNERLKLNFGHTLAHAIEAKGDYKLRHGEAVAIGMVYMTTLSEKRGLIPASVNYSRLGEKFKGKSASQILIDILSQYGLPSKLDYRIDDLIDYMSLDKKNRGQLIKLVLLEDIGKAVIKDIGQGELGEFLKYEQVSKGK